jgi:hypothetical protein
MELGRSALSGKPGFCMRGFKSDVKLGGKNKTEQKKDPSDEVLCQPILGI